MNNSGSGATIAVTNRSSNVINATVVLGDNLTVSGSGMLAFGTSSSITGGYSLNMNGAGGTLILSGSDSYTGGTIVDAGTLVVTNAGALPTGTSVTVGAGGTFVFDPTVAAAPAAFAADSQIHPVPEPGSLVLLGIGAIGLVGYGLRRRSAKKLRTQRPQTNKTPRPPCPSPRVRPSGSRHGEQPDPAFRTSVPSSC